MMISRLFDNFTVNNRLFLILLLALLLMFACGYVPGSGGQKDEDSEIFDDEVIDDDDSLNDDDDTSDDDDIEGPIQDLLTFSSDGKFTIDLWQWGAKAAISLSLDEGIEEPYLILMPEVESRGWKMTFFIYTEQPYWEECWDELLLAHQNGHEVTSHTHTHPDMTTLTEAEIRTELETANAELKSHLGDDLKLQSFAYPYEMTNAFVWNIVKEYHDYARSGDHGVPVPPNPVPLNDAISPDWGALTAKANTTDITLASWNGWTDAAVLEGKWFIEEYHGVCDGDVCGGWEPRTIEDFRSHFDHIESYGEDIWVAPVRDVGNYIKERNSARFRLFCWNEDNIKVLLIDDYGTNFDTPLTFVVDTEPEWNWSEIEVRQNGSVMTSQKLGPNQFRVEGVPNPDHPIFITPK